MYAILSEEEILGNYADSVDRVLYEAAHDEIHLWTLSENTMRSGKFTRLRGHDVEVDTPMLRLNSLHGAFVFTLHCRFNVSREVKLGGPYLHRFSAADDPELWARLWRRIRRQINTDMKEL